MLLNSFFSIVKSDSQKGSIKAILKIDSSHRIFEGHFPQAPIVPGVCMIQMVKEVIENNENCECDLISGDNIKFLSVLNPTEYPEIEIEILIKENTSLDVIATLFVADVTFFKMKAVLVFRA